MASATSESSTTPGSSPGREAEHLEPPLQRRQWGPELVGQFARHGRPRLLALGAALRPHDDEPDEHGQEESPGLERTGSSASRRTSGVSPKWMCMQLGIADRRVRASSRRT